MHTSMICYADKQFIYYPQQYNYTLLSSLLPLISKCIETLYKYCELLNSGNTKLNICLQRLLSAGYFSEASQVRDVLSAGYFSAASQLWCVKCRLLLCSQSVVMCYVQATSLPPLRCDVLRAGYFYAATQVWCVTCRRLLCSQSGVMCYLQATSLQPVRCDVLRAGYLILCSQSGLMRYQWCN